MRRVTKFQFEVILKVIETGSYTAATKELFMSQGNVSSLVTRVEKKLGYHVFRRASRNKPIELTHEGALALMEAKKRLKLK